MKAVTNFWQPRHCLLLLLLIFVATGAAASELNFTIIHSSDEHSSLVPVPYSEYLNGGNNASLGGFARLATLVKQIRGQKNAEPVILLSSGDFSGGTPFSWLSLSGQAPELELMRQIGYLAATLGNHEFDYGPEGLAKYLSTAASNAGFPQIIASNIVIPADHELNLTTIKPFMVHELSNGLKIGIFGLLGKDAHRLSPAAKPLDFSDQQRCAQEMVKRLKDSGAEVIIALSHSGYFEDEELARKVPGIHLILGGHHHIATNPPPLINGTLIMHSGAYLESVGQLDLAFDRQSSRLRLRNSETKAPFIHKLDSSIEADPIIQAGIDKNTAELEAIIASFSAGTAANIEATVLESNFALTRHQAGSETSIGNFITDAMRLEVEKLTGHRVDLALHANGMIRGNLIPAASENVKGNISLYDLITLSSLGHGQDGNPGYALVSFYLSETEVLNLLEIGTLLPMLWNDIYFLQFSGIRYRYDPARAFWLWLPIINKPLPAYRSILSAERYLGDGYQGDDNYRVLKNDSSQLCQVVTTHYLASYLPMVGKKLPRLNLVLKDRDGRPVGLDETVIHIDNREFKLWEATARYAASLASAPGLPGQIPDYYRTVGKRISKSKGPSLLFWPGLGLALVLLLLLGWRFMRRKGRP